MKRVSPNLVFVQIRRGLAASPSPWPSGRIATLCAALLVMTVTAALGEVEHHAMLIEVHAGPHHREDTPVVLDLPDSLAPWQHFRLTRLTDQAPVDAQRLAGDGRDSLVWLIRQPLAAGQSRRYRLVPVSQPPRRAAVDHVLCDDDGKHRSRCMDRLTAAGPVFV